jgi:hypothetical protein
MESECESKSGVHERDARSRPRKAEPEHKQSRGLSVPGEGLALLALAQSTDVAGATASICNAAWVRYGGTSGHVGFALTLSVVRCP